MTPEELKSLMQEQFAAFKETLPKFVDEKGLNTAFSEFKEDMAKEYSQEELKSDIAELTKSVKNQAREIAKMNENKGSETKKIGVSKETIADVAKALETSKRHEITVKAAAAFTTANVSSGNHILTYEVDSMIHEAPREENAVFPLILKGSTSSKTIYWANRGLS